MKDSVNLMYSSFKANPILCFHDDVISFNRKELFVIHVDP